MLAFQEESTLDNVELEPFANEQKIAKINSGTIWQNADANDASQIIKIQRAKNNFCIAEVTKLCCDLYEPALLYSRDMDKTLGIIRQIQKPVAPGHSTYRILIEKWDGEISCVQSDSESIILITKENHLLEVLLPLNKYTSGTTIKVKNGEILLQNLREENPNFMHFEAIMNP